MGEIQGLARSKVLLYDRPCSDLSRIRKQEFDNRGLAACFVYLEQGFSRNPAVRYGFVPAFGIFPLTYNHIETVVPQVQGLSGSLDTVSEDRNSLVFQHFPCFFKRKF